MQRPWKEIVITSPRIIALLDILGFSDLVSKHNFGELFENYVKAIREAIRATDPKIEYVLFSDSIVLLSHRDEPDDLLNIAEVVGTLSYDLITEHALPIRGCVAHGDISYSSNDNDVVVAGTPIVEAYRYEHMQKWVGVMIAPSTVNKFPLRENCDIGNIDDVELIPEFKEHFKWKMCIQEFMGIPFPNDTLFRGYVVVPHSRTSTDSTHFLEDFRRLQVAMTEQQLAAGTVEAQYKHINARRFMVELIRKWDGVRMNQYVRDAIWETREETKCPPERA